MPTDHVRAADRAPDPRGVDDPSGFVAQLRLLKVWAGNPSYERLARASGVPRSTLADALSRRNDRLPALPVVRRFVLACGVAGDDALAWEEQWRRLQARAALAEPEEAQTVRSGHPVPRQLPPDVRGFVGHGGMVAALDGMLDHDGGAGPVVISAVSGTAGVGKTALAVHWAHRVADRFPDGQLHVNLRGYHPGPPMRPVEALAHLLSALGTRPEHVPTEPGPAAGLYRSLLAGRRVLVLLDNAASPEQVRPLLPGTPGCLVLVTSRDQLTGLVARDGAHRLTLDPLPHQEAVGLLRGLLGERVDDEPDAAAALADRCVGLPLALRIAAAHLTGRPDQRLASYVRRLDTGDRLAALRIAGDPQTAVGAAFDLSYRRLTRAAQRLFRLLGLVPGPDVTARTAAALAGTTDHQAGRLLDRLAGAHLLEQPAPGRYTCHDLLRAYAAERTHRTDDESDRQAAAGRLYAYYLHRSDAAAAALYPETLRLPPPADGDGPAPAERFADPGQALAWLESERPNLVAAITHTAADGPRPVAWRLADRLRGYFWLRMHTVDWLATARAGLTAAQADHHLPAQAASQLSLAGLCRRQDQYRPAIDHATQALALSRRAGWSGGEAAALSCLGGIRQRMGQLEQAADDHARALAINRRTGRLDSQAADLYNLGLVHYDLGRLRQGADQGAQVLAIAEQRGTRGGQTLALGLLGLCLHALGRFDEAREHYTRALRLARAADDRSQEAIALLNLATLHCDTGRHREALGLARDAVAKACGSSTRQVEAAALIGLATVHHHLGDHRQAIEHYREALDLAGQAGNRFAETEARIGLADSLRCHGECPAALAQARQALELARGAGYRMLQGTALTALSAIHLAGQRPEPAVLAAQAALTIHRETGHRLGEARSQQLLGSATRT